MELFLLLVFFCAFYMALEIFFSKVWNKGLHVDMHFEDSIVREGGRTRLVETISNQKRIALPILHVKITLPRSFHFPLSNNSAITDCYYRHDIFSVGRNEELVRKLDFTCTKRGVYHVNSLSYSTRDYFLANTFAINKTVEEYLYVTPKKMLPMELPLKIQGLIGDTVSEKAMFEDPFEFKGIRQYQPYDNYRSINWKISARQQELQVNTHFSTYTCELFFVLNLSPRKLSENIDILEKSISILSTMTSHFIHLKIPVGFTTNGLDIETNRMLTILPGLGTHHEQKIDLKLACIDLGKPCEPIEKCLASIPDKQHTQVIFISASQHHEALETFAEIERLSEHAIWILPVIPDENKEESPVIKPQNGTLLKWEVNLYEVTD